jgi:hypothetical protein
MRLRILLAAVLVLALVVAPTATGGAPKKKTRTLEGTIHMAVIGDNGQTGSKFAGDFVGRPLRRSALLFQNTISGTTSTGKGVIYTKSGSVRFNSTNEIQPQPDGSLLVPGTFKITGGTGRYKGASGRGTLEGGLPAGGNVYELTVNGRIRY